MSNNFTCLYIVFPRKVFFGGNINSLGHRSDATNYTELCYDFQGFNATLTEAVDTPGTRGADQVKDMNFKLPDTSVFNNLLVVISQMRVCDAYSCQTQVLESQ